MVVRIRTNSYCTYPYSCQGRTVEAGLPSPSLPPVRPNSRSTRLASPRVREGRNAGVVSSGRGDRRLLGLRSAQQYSARFLGELGVQSRVGLVAQGTRVLAGTLSARAIRSRFRRVQLRSPRSHPATYDQFRSDLSATASSVRPAANRASRTFRPNSTRSGSLGPLAERSAGVTANAPRSAPRRRRRTSSAWSSVVGGHRDEHDLNPHVDTKGHPSDFRRNQGVAPDRSFV
jgi:hypothetical protein